jgi:autotransporter adhesin
MKKNQDVASTNQALNPDSEALSRALARARAIASNGSRRRAALATLTLFGLPHMAHAAEAGQLASASADTSVMYATQVTRALGALTSSQRNIGAQSAPSALAAIQSRELILLTDPTLPPEQLIKSGPTDIQQQIEALGSDSIAIGLNTHANGLQAVAIGTNTSSGNEGAVAIGNSAISSGVGSTAIGVNAQATNGARALAIGNFAQAGSTDSITIGNNSIVGDTGNTMTDKSISVGSNNVVSGANSVALGNQLTVSATNSMVLGNDVSVSGTNSVVLGSGSDGSQSNVVSIGAKGAERRIVNVAPGLLSAASTDAVNASQLHRVASSTAAALGGGATLGSDGKISSPSFTVGGKAYADVGGAIEAAASAGVGASTDAVRYDSAARTSVSLGDGKAGVQVHNVLAGKADTDAVNLSQLKKAGLATDSDGSPTNALVTYDDTVKGRVTLAGAAGTVVSNLAKGTKDTDAVNLKQLKDAGLTIDSNGNAANAFVAYSDSAKTKVTLGGKGGTVVSNVATGTADMDAVT